MIAVTLRDVIEQRIVARVKFGAIPREGELVRKGDKTFRVTQIEWDFTTRDPRVTVWVALRSKGES